jgi:hypothetical protein
VGGWRRTPGRDTVVIDLKLVAPSGAEQEQLLKAVRRAAFVSKPVDLRGLGARRRVNRQQQGNGAAAFEIHVPRLFRPVVALLGGSSMNVGSSLIDLCSQ